MFTHIERLKPALLPVTSSVVSGMGMALPAHLMASTEIDRRLGKQEGWLERACGVASRHVAGPGETQETMAAAAARAALRDAGLELADVGLLLFGAAVGRQPIPATAPLVKRELGGAALAFPAYDVNATCLSALVGMDLAALHLAAGRARHVLVVTAEIASRALPWHDAPDTAGLFGDGAAAFVMSAAGEGRGVRPRFGAFHMETFAEGYEACTLASGGTGIDYHSDPEGFARSAYFRMDGRALYRVTAAALPGFLDRLLGRAGLRRDDIDLVVPHQASPHALAHIIRRGGFAPQRVFDRVRTIGNQVAASIPVALNLAASDGRLQPGMRVLLIGTSAGVSLGGAILET
ncbi:3-oxoacyl-[acyl-carrier-protein] synthase III C-terminal domain-containing protein [Hyphomonas sp.]|jgi:3-oxoacyl-[acyl-carrier-protein] synthase-3|uniref:3-oxoacyl-ACP synthase III family protein n=1 Tax=Hyphomonas sp. TaxID=87 RepID=UPI0025C18FF5|nr:3-oxoacyl-[acyl-carrier-protein] synthase III C-terminal domain-containing protein [Hyphomonas sp.]